MGIFVTGRDVMIAAAVWAAAFALAAVVARALASRRAPRLPSPTAFVWFVAASYFVFFAAATLARHRGMATCGLDLGYYANAVWQFGHGHPFAQTLDPPSNFYSQPCTPLLAAFAPFSYIFPDGAYLLVVQALALAAGVVLVYRLARAEDGPGWPAAWLAFSFALAPALHGATFYDFHPRALGVPLVLAAFYFFGRRRFWAGVICAALVALAREELALHAVALAAWGGFAAGRRRLGLVTAAVIAAYFFGVCCFLYPKLTYAAGSGRAYFLPFFEKGADAAAPAGTNWLPKAAYLTVILGPGAAFLPAAGGALIALATPVAVPVLTTNTNVFQIGWQYPLVPLTFAYAAAALGLKRLGSRPGRKTEVFLPAAAVAAVAFQLALIVLFAPRLYRLEMAGAFPTAHERALAAAAARVGRDVPICADDIFTPRLAHRRYCYLFGQSLDRDLPVKPRALLLDRRAHGQMDTRGIRDAAGRWGLKLATYDDDYAYFTADAPGLPLYDWFRRWYFTIEEWQCSAPGGKRFVADAGARDGRAALVVRDLRHEPARAMLYPPGPYDLTFYLRPADPAEAAHITLVATPTDKELGPLGVYAAEADVVPSEKYSPYRLTFSAGRPFWLYLSLITTAPVYFDRVAIDGDGLRFLATVATGGPDT